MTPIHAKTNANIVIFQLQWYILNCIYFLEPTFHPLGDFLNPILALLGQGLKKSPIG
jgi:hypothetical protein